MIGAYYPMLCLIHFFRPSTLPTSSLRLAPTAREPPASALAQVQPPLGPRIPFGPGDPPLLQRSPHSNPGAPILSPSRPLLQLPGAVLLSLLTSLAHPHDSERLVATLQTRRLPLTLGRATGGTCSRYTSFAEVVTSSSFALSSPTAVRCRALSSRTKCDGVTRAQASSKSGWTR